MKKKYCLITGCAGFIGGHLAEYLLKKDMVVYGIDNLSTGKKSTIDLIKKKYKNFIFFNKDICQIKSILINIKKIDYVFHFAGYGELVPSMENPIEYIENNSLNSAKLINEIIKKKYKIKKFIYAASSTCYGLNNGKTSEKSKISLEHPYALSKYAGELFILNLGKIYNLPVISIRIFNAYGPRSRTNSSYGAVIGVFLKQKIENFPLTIVGDGSQKRDFLYISDLCDAFYKSAVSKYKNEIFNLGFGKANSINYLSSLIKAKKKKFIKWRPGEPIKTEANITKIKKFIKWKPKISLKTGINTVLNDIIYFKEAPLWTAKKINYALRTWNKFLK